MFLFDRHFCKYFALIQIKAATKRHSQKMIYRTASPSGKRGKCVQTEREWFEGEEWQCIFYYNKVLAFTLFLDLTSKLVIP